MIIGVLQEDEPESRVSLLPEHIASIVKSSIEVLVESDAGIWAFANNAAYEKGGRQNSVQSRRPVADWWPHGVTSPVVRYRPVNWNWATVHRRAQWRRTGGYLRRPVLTYKSLRAAQLATNEEWSIVEREIRTVAKVCAEQEGSQNYGSWNFVTAINLDPFALYGEWNELPGDLTHCHSIWAQFYKIFKRQRSAQDVVELAYHLAHSSENLIKFHLKW